MNKSSLWYLLFIFSLLTLFSCDKHQNFAINLLPQEDLINTSYVDTFTVNVKTSRYTHIRTTYQGACLVGSYKDPIFGYTKASAGFQLLQFSYPDFNDTSITYTVDSVFLRIELDPQYTPYGKPYNPLPLYVFPIKDSLTLFSKVYADDSLSKYADLTDTLGYTEFSLYQNGNDSMIKIYIDKSLAQKFIDSAQYYFFNENGSFNSRFPGIIVTPGTDFYDAALYRIPFPIQVEQRNATPEDLKTALYIYYHPDTLQDTSFLFRLPSSSSFSLNFTLIDHNYDGTDIFNSDNDSVVYLQTAGTALNLDFPYISALKNKAIHKAILYMPLENPKYTDQTSFSPPDKLYVVARSKTDSQAAPILLNDYMNSNREYYGFSRQLDHYEINITQIIQKLANDTDPLKDTTFYSIIDLFSNQKLTRAVLTTQHNSRPLKLIVFYSNL